MINWFLSFADSEIFAGLVGASLLGSLIVAARNLPARVFHAWVHLFTCEVSVYSEDEAFGWLNQWLSSHPSASGSRRLVLGLNERFDDSNTRTVRWYLAPGNGLHYFWIDRRLVVLNRVKEEKTDAYSNRRRETITLRTIGRSSERLRAIVSRAHRAQTQRNRLHIYQFISHWRWLGERPLRAFETIFLPPAQKQRILADIEWFQDAGDWYTTRGVPHRRGYLLSGPPGCGKTSLVTALASRLGRPIYVVNLHDIYTDNALIEALGQPPANAIVLMEDIDALSATAPRTRRKPANQGTVAARDAPDMPPETQEQPQERTVSLSGLLNAIDGVASASGRILFMTTNHPERLDAALRRPGRVDLHETIEPIGGLEVRAMFLKFFPNEHVIADTLAAELNGQTYPAAHLQGAFLLHRDDAGAAAAAIVNG